jgi:hypothetical protein
MDEKQKMEQKEVEKVLSSLFEKTFQMENELYACVGCED